MERDKLVEMLNQRAFTAEDSLALISEYCQDKKIDEAKATKLLQSIIQLPTLMLKAMQDHVIPHMRIKYNIFYIADKQGNIIYYY